MSNIPSTAISATLTPIQRDANQALRARNVQSQKNLHHSEEVDELDDTAVNSVRDEKGGHGGGESKEEKEKRGAEELVDIEALREVPQGKGAVAAEGSSVSHLDISA